MRNVQEKKVDEKKIMTKILDCYCILSPENLSCDGELSQSATNQRYRQFTKELKKCFKLLGREVSEIEAYTWAETTKHMFGDNQ